MFTIFLIFLHFFFKIKVTNIIYVAEINVEQKIKKSFKYITQNKIFTLFLFFCGILRSYVSTLTMSHNLKLFFDKTI